MKFINIAVLLFAMILACGARAQEGGLYAAPPPPDAAFVRVLNVSSTGSINVSLAAVAFPVPPATLSPYSYVTKGDYDVAGAGTFHVSIDAQQFYTIVVAADGTAKLLQDEPLKNPARAGLYFYNATGVPLQLSAKVSGKAAPVFQNVAPGAEAFREVNAFEVSFDVVKDGSTVFSLPATAMVRQQGFSVVALPSGDTISAIQTANDVATAAN